MRDVTDNKTGELEVGEVKRGRGRPRKADAMTNAQRQAAYRARHRVLNTVAVGGVTGKPGMKVSEVFAAPGEDWEAQAYLLRRERDEARLERKRAVAALEEARRQVRLAEEERNRAFQRNDELRAELTELKASAGNVVTGNDNPLTFAEMCELIAAVKKSRTHAMWMDLRADDNAVWQRAVVLNSAVSQEQMNKLRSVTDRAWRVVTKKGAKA